MCQPYASYRFSTSSVKARSVEPSIWMLLSSYSTTSPPSLRWPASEDASDEMPSCRQPSPQITNTQWSTIVNPSRLNVAAMCACRSEEHTSELQSP